MHLKKQNTSSRSVRSQLTAISFSTEEHATLKDSDESRNCISSKIGRSENFVACVKKEGVHVY